MSLLERLFGVYILARMFPYMLRVSFGRWYAFRDAPHWLVVLAARAGQGSDDDTVFSFARQAREELRTRRRTGGKWRKA